MLSLLLRKDSKIVENQDKQQDDIKQIAIQFTFPVRDEMLYFFRGLHETTHGHRFDNQLQVHGPLWWKFNENNVKVPLVDD
jgi:hypothetical protein